MVMTTDDMLGVTLPFVLAAILVGGALFGSRLAPTTRARIVKLFLAPLFVVGGAARITYTIIEKDWIGLPFWALLVSLAFFRVYRLYRPLPDA